jgi:small conductance mechanosensitive channel
VAKPLTILAIILIALLVSRILHWLIKRSMMRAFSGSGSNRLARLREHTPNVLLRSQEWDLRSEARVHTLIAVFRSVASIIVWFVAVVWILGILHIDFGPLVAGAGIIGVALGFGAQNVVRDTLAGYFIVVEDQMGVGDVVDLGPDARGKVEKVTLRSTRVRDVQGTVWHVPNGQILRVGNKSQEWAQALIDLEVDVDTEYEAASDVILRVAEAMSAEPDWSTEILASPEVLGIENFTAEGSVISLVVKTRPASQFGVMRELRRRLKAAFDEAGVRLPAARPELWVHLEPGDDPTGV